MPTLTRSRKKTRPRKPTLSAARRKIFVPPVLLPEEIALENSILAAAARDVAALSR